MSALVAGRTIALPPASCDYTVGLPASLGMMGNDSLGDCTCAALGHALQVWSANANPPIDTEPDANIISLYSQACGYQGNAATDQGGVEQDVLTYAILSGIPVGNGGAQRHRITAFVEVDTRNLDDVKIAINDCGVCYIGFNVPSYLPMTPGTPWDVQPSADFTIVGGHAVVLAGYNDATQMFKLISWGAVYEMTYAFFQEFCDEAYAIADADWIKATGTSPGGLSITDLETQMQAIKSAS